MLHNQYLQCNSDISTTSNVDIRDLHSLLREGGSHLPDATPYQKLTYIWYEKGASIPKAFYHVDSNRKCEKGRIFNFGGPIYNPIRCPVFTIPAQLPET
jgi:hypothetical protein